MAMKKSHLRLNKIIENDRLLITSDTSSLIVYDLKRLLDNYFNMEGEVNLIVSAGKSGYDITINGKASGIKSFKVIKN